MHTANSPAIRSFGLPTLSRILSAPVARFNAWNQRSRSRKSLSRLDPRILRDIGLDPVALEELERQPFWIR